LKVYIFKSKRKRYLW